MKNVRVKNILLCTLPFLASAAMLTVIQAPVSWSRLAWVSLVPFILGCSPNTKPARLMLVTYVVSLCYWLGNLYWVFPITIIGWAAFCLYTALLWPILGLCLRYCRIKKIPLFIATAALFVGAESLQGFPMGGFFWRHLSHSQYENISLIQIADIFGSAGISFLIAMVNGLLAELIIAAGRRELFKVSQLLKVVLVFAAVIAAVGYGHWRIAQSDEFIESGPLVASLQSNVPQSVKRTFQAEEEIFDSLMEQSKAAAEAGAELIVWPETMVQAILNTDIWPFLVSAERNKAFDKALREHSKETSFVLVGAYGGSIRRDDDLDISLAWYNSAFLYRPDGSQNIRRYDKIHLVLFGEYLPFQKSCQWLYNLLMKFTPYNYDYSLEAGSEYTIFEMTSPIGNSAIDSNDVQQNSASTGTSTMQQNAKAYKFGVIICYEDTIPKIAQKFALDEHGRKSLDWLVNISNDGWFVRFESEPAGRQAYGKVFPSTELAQHAAICVFRAVENRLPVLRSVNTGISCLIDSLGQMRNGYVAASRDFPVKVMNREAITGWFVDEMPIDRRVTFFSKYGRWLDFCCRAGLVLLIIVQFSAKFFGTGKHASGLEG